MMDRVPASALATMPDTGASRKVMPISRSRRSVSCVHTGCEVPQSTNTCPAFVRVRVCVCGVCVRCV